MGHGRDRSGDVPLSFDRFRRRDRINQHSPDKRVTRLVIESPALLYANSFQRWINEVTARSGERFLESMIFFDKDKPPDAERPVGRIAATTNPINLLWLRGDIGAADVADDIKASLADFSFERGALAAEVVNVVRLARRIEEKAKAGADELTVLNAEAKGNVPLRGGA